MDPLTRSYPWYTPYQFAGNTPIWAIDLDGAEPLVAIKLIQYYLESKLKVQDAKEVVKGTGRGIRNIAFSLAPVQIATPEQSARVAEEGYFYSTVNSIKDIPKNLANYLNKLEKSMRQEQQQKKLRRT